ncbi:MAG: serine/threonine-protein kinase [Myxococcota bacterium]
MDRPEPPSSVGEGRYLLHEQLGEGGMAWVYRATDRRLGAARAVKLIRLDEEPRASWRRRFQVEAKAMARVRHPNVVQVFDTGCEIDVDYIVMEYVRGGSLDGRLADQGTLAPAEAVRLLRQVLHGLDAVHGAGIVHRDVKPGNILLDEAGDARLTDFGIAMVDDAAMRRTRAGVGMGSFAYMPPEQRQDASGVTHAADIYAAGATLYRLLTGETPMDLFLAGVTSPRWDGVPRPIAVILRRACAEHPPRRYATALAFAEALDGLDLEAPAPGRRPVRSVPPATIPQEPTELAPSRARGLPLVALALVVSGIIGAAVALSGRREPPPPQVSAPAEAPSEVWTAQGPPTPPAPEAAPVMAPAPPSERLPPPVASPAIGTWRMSNNGVRFDLVLTGPTEALRGEARSQLDGITHIEPLSGAYDPESRRLTLVENNGVVRYDIVLDADGGRGEGTLDAPGSRRVVTLDRVP